MKTKECCICRAKFIPTNKNAETRQCCKECRIMMNEELQNEFHQLRYDDKHFNEQYNANEFIEWVVDYELTKN